MSVTAWSQARVLAVASAQSTAPPGVLVREGTVVARLEFFPLPPGVLADDYQRFDVLVGPEFDLVTGDELYVGVDGLRMFLAGEEDGKPATVDCVSPWWPWEATGGGPPTQRHSSCGGEAVTEPIKATFPLVPYSVAEGAYVQVGPAFAIYRVVGVEHGPPAGGLGGAAGLMAAATGMKTSHSASSVLRLDPVDAHDVPWTADVRPLALPATEPTEDRP